MSAPHRVSAEHSLQDYQLKNIRAKLCLEDAEITGGAPLSRYTQGDETLRWIENDTTVRESDLPSVLQPRRGQQSITDALLHNKWSPTVPLDRILDIPHRNGKTGKYNANISVKNAGYMVPVSIEKIEVISDEIWKSTVIPFERDNIRRQVRALLEQHNDGEEITDAELNTLSRKLVQPKLKEELIKSVANSPHNPAYLEVLMLACGDLIRVQHKSPHFPVYVYSFTVQDPHFYHGLQKDYNPAEVVVAMSEKLDTTLAASWSNDKALSGRRMLADICQVVTCLAELQAHLGGINNDCRVESFRAREEDPHAHIVKLWSSTHISIPTYGNVWKLTGHKYCSLMFGGKRLVSIERQDLLERSNIPYQRDLIMFARSAAPYVKKLLPESDPFKIYLTNMLQAWTTCTQSTDGLSPLNLIELEQEVCKGDDSDECRRKFLAPLDNGAVCNNAIPYLQLNFFSQEFGITDKRVKALGAATIYQLGIPMNNDKMSSDKTE